MENTLKSFEIECVSTGERLRLSARDSREAMLTLATLGLDLTLVATKDRAFWQMTTGSEVYRLEAEDITLE